MKLKMFSCCFGGCCIRQIPWVITHVTTSQPHSAAVAASHFWGHFSSSSISSKYKPCEKGPSELQAFHLAEPL